MDAHVGKNIIKKVLSNEGLIGNRCRILATNSVPVLHEANDIYLIAGGAFVEHGKFKEVMKRNGDLAKLIKEYGRKKTNQQRKKQPRHQLNLKKKTILTGNQILLFMTSLIRMNWLTKLSIMLASKIVVLLNKQYCVVQVLFHTVIITKMMKQTMVK